jgi:hypothetical protein
LLNAPAVVDQGSESRGARLDSLCEPDGYPD